MCDLSTSLVFGLPVRTSSLIFACDAFPPFEAPLRFFGLVGVRARRGVLEINTGRAVSIIGLRAAGLLDRIKDELVKVELDEADSLYTNALFMTKEHDPKLLWRSFMWCWLKQTNDRWWMRVALEEQFGTRKRFDEARTERLTRLLGSYGLALGPESLLYILQIPEDQASPYAATYIALSDPKATTSLESSSSTSCYNDEQDAKHFYVDLSPQVPANARQRFRSLIRTFHLEPLRISDVPPHPLSDAERAVSSAQATKMRMKKMRYRFTRLGLSEVEPGWKLHTRFFAET